MGSSRATPVAADSILSQFSKQVARRSGDPMIVSPARQATFGDIDRLALVVGEKLSRDCEPECGTVVGLAATNGPGFLAGFLALRRAGTVVLLLDASAPPVDRQRAMTALGARGVLECLAPWPSSAAGFCFTKNEERAVSIALPGIAVIKLTSGSTGTPRGVAMPDEALLADEGALTGSMGLRCDDRLWGAVPFSHSYGFTTLVLSSLVRGLTLVLPSDQGPFAALGAARSLGATVFPTVPAYIQALLRLPTPPSWPECIRLVISAGAVLPGAVAARFRHTWSRSVHTFYGSSECGGICYDRDGGAAERGTVGTPVNGVRVSLVAQEQCPSDEGLVVVESKSVGQMYLPDGDSRLSAGRLETTDVGAWRGGELVLRRRVDRVINIRGRKVDPSEVEMVLAAIDGVEEVVVIGIGAPDGQDEIIRAVIACPTKRPHYRDVAAWCRQRLAHHKVPRSVVFVDAIPRTPRGKIDRAALLRLPAVDNEFGGSGD